MELGYSSYASSSLASFSHHLFIDAGLASLAAFPLGIPMMVWPCRYTDLVSCSGTGAHTNSLPPSMLPWPPHTADLEWFATAMQSQGLFRRSSFRWYERRHWQAEAAPELQPQQEPATGKPARQRGVKQSVVNKLPMVRVTSTGNAIALLTLP
jgi:hypothetical protein